MELFEFSTFESHEHPFAAAHFLSFIHSFRSRIRPRRKPRSIVIQYIYNTPTAEPALAPEPLRVNESASAPTSVPPPSLQIQPKESPSAIDSTGTVSGGADHKHTPELKPAIAPKPAIEADCASTSAPTLSKTTRKDPLPRMSPPSVCRASETSAHQQQGHAAKVTNDSEETDLEKDSGPRLSQNEAATGTQNSDQSAAAIVNNEEILRVIEPSRKPADEVKYGDLEDDVKRVEVPSTVGGTESLAEGNATTTGRNEEFLVEENYVYDSPRYRLYALTSTSSIGGERKCRSRRVQTLARCFRGLIT